MKWLTTLLAAAGVAAALAAPGAAKAQKFKIGIAALGPHPALKQAAAGFKAGMAKAGFVEGKNISYIELHASFKPALIAQMIGRMVAAKVNIIVPMTTPVSQAAVGASKRTGIPVVFIVVADPVKAQLTPSWKVGGKHATGATNNMDFVEVFKFVRRILPNARRVGFPYSPGDVVDERQLTHIRAAAKKLGMSVAAVAVDLQRDIPVRIQSLRGKADFVYIAGSKTIQPAVPAVAAAARRIGVPVIDWVPTTVRKHVTLATYTVSYFKLGLNAAGLAAQVLRGKRTAELAPVAPTVKDYVPFISARQMKTFGLKVPAGLKDCKCIIK